MKEGVKFVAFTDEGFVELVDMSSYNGCDDHEDCFTGYGIVALEEDAVYTSDTLEHGIATAIITARLIDNEHLEPAVAIAEALQAHS